MSGAAAPPQMPPWLQEQLKKYQKTKEELDAIRTQMNYLESEKAGITRTLEELKKAADDETVFKFAGSALVRTTKSRMISELEEKQELAKTRSIVTGKQEARLTQSLKEQDTKITEMMRGKGMTLGP